MITEKISNSGILSGTINASSNLTMGIGSSNSLIGGNINTFTKEIDPTIPDYIKAISKEDIDEWDNNAVVNEEQNKTLMGLEELIDVITPKNTVSGELVHITDALPLPTFENKVDGNVKQEITEGRNLFETIINTYQGATNGLTVTQNNDGSVNVQGTGTTNWSNITVNRPIKIEPNVDYCFSINKVTNYRPTLKITFEDDSQQNIYIYSGETYKKFQVTKNVKDVYAYIYDGNNFSNINETFYFQVEKGSTPTEYKKFTNGASPNPEYPQEIEVLEGYNLIDIQNNNYIIKNTENTRRRPNYGNGIILDYADINHKDYRFVYVNYPLKANKYYCINAIYTNLGTLKTNVSIYLPDLEQYPINGKVFKPTSDTEWISFYISQENFVEGCKYAITDVILQEVESATATPKPYVPYGCVGIKTHGKNELDLSKIPTNTIYGIEVSYNKDTKKVRFKGTATNTFPTSTGIPIFLSKGTYTFSSVGNADTFLWFYDEHKNFISGPNNRTNKTITLEKDIVEFRVGVENLVIGNTYDLEIGYQLEKGSVATEIEDYKEQIVYLDLKGNFVGKIKDSEIEDELYTDKKNIWLDKNVNKRIFTGEEDWVENTSVGTIELLINDKYARYGFDGLMCSHFHIRTGTDTSNYVGIDNNHTNIRIWGTNKTLDEFKAFAKEEYNKGTPITLVYQTKKTETKHLGELPEPIKTFEGVNNIQLLANIPTEIEVKYALDVKKYADDRYLELTNALVSTGANL